MKTKWICYIFLFIFYFPLSLKADTKATQTWYLKDGSTINGELMSETPLQLVVKTSFGLIKIDKKNLKPTKIRLELTDNTSIIGTLIEETKTSYKLNSNVGEIEINKNQVRSFSKILEPQHQGYGFFGQDGFPFFLDVEKENLRKGYSHSIEPLIDIFFDPTGYTFKKDEVYLSGLSLAYGLSDDLLVSSNVVSLVGMNDAGQVNPNVEIKKRIYTHKEGSKEWNTAISFRFDSVYKNGVNKYVDTVKYENMSRDNNISLPQEISRTNQADQTKKDLRPSVDRISDDGDEDYGFTEERNEVRYENINGWNARVFYARSVSWLLDRGGRFGFHWGAKLELNPVGLRVGWFKRPSYRVYAAFDLDLSRKFKALGEIYYDPDAYNWVTSQEGAVLDVGIMYAASDTFRFLVHVQPYIIGIYWRL